MFVLGSCGIGGCLVILAVGEDESRRQREEVAAAIPWLLGARQNCESYDAAPNDIQRSAIFNENEALIVGQLLTEVRANLDVLSTGQGGGSLTIVVTAGGARFSNLGTIGADSPVYTAASSLSTGQCVVVSGQVTAASSVLERSKVCDPDYNVRWTAIRPCDETPSN
jgi:hypothetical protein